MKKSIRTIILLLLFSTGLLAQGKFLTKTGNISFYSHTLVEDITAENHEVASIIDSGSGEIVINVPMTSFHFEKSLMEEHFNENYVESEKYPKATFKGTIENNAQVDYSSAGNYPVTVSGEMTIHGKTQPFSTVGSLEVISGGLVARTRFKLNPEEYNIRIPNVVRKNIAEEMEVTVEMTYKPL